MVKSLEVTFNVETIRGSAPFVDADGNVIGLVSIGDDGVAHVTFAEPVELPQKFVGMSIGSKP